MVRFTLRRWPRWSRFVERLGPFLRANRAQEKTQNRLKG